MVDDLKFDENEFTETKKDAKPKANIKTYCGPTIKNVVVQFSTFRDNLTPDLKELAENCPAINKLLVDPDNLGHTRLKLKDRSSPEAIFYRQIQKYIGGIK